MQVKCVWMYYFQALLTLDLLSHSAVQNSAFLAIMYNTVKINCVILSYGAN